MMRLRAIVAQVYRGGRSIGSRSFCSSGNESMGVGGGTVVRRSGLEILVEKASKKNGVGLVPCTLFGYVCYMASEAVEAIKSRHRMAEEAKLRSQRRDELISKMKSEMRGSTPSN